MKLLDGNRKVRTPDGGEMWAAEVPKRRTGFLPAIGIAIVRNTREIQPIVEEFVEQRSAISTALGLTGSEDDSGEDTVTFQSQLSELAKAEHEVAIRSVPASALAIGKTSSLKRFPVAGLLGTVIKDDFGDCDTEEFNLSADEIHTAMSLSIGLDSAPVVEEKEGGESKSKAFVFSSNAWVALARNIAILRPIALELEDGMNAITREMNPKNVAPDKLAPAIRRELVDRQTKLKKARQTVALYPVKFNDLLPEKNIGLPLVEIGQLPFVTMPPEEEGSKEPDKKEEAENSES